MIRGAMVPEPFTFDGEHYSVTDYDGQPKPVQAPCPPILIGGGGPRVLGIVPREADIVGVNGTLDAGVFGPEAFATMTADAVEAKVAIVAEPAGDRLGRHRDEHPHVLQRVTDDRPAASSGRPCAVGRRGDARRGPVRTDRQPGTDRRGLAVAARADYGFSYVIVGAGEIDSFAPVVAELAGT